jgi:hypothetical protein
VTLGKVANPLDIGHSALVPDSTDADGERSLNLAVFVEGSHDVLTSEAFRALAAGLASESWPLGPPISVAPPDAGIALAIHAVSASLDRSMDAADLDAAERLLTAVASLSEQTDAVLAVEYDGEVVGWIEGGELDNALREGLLGEWHRRLGA